MQNVQRSVQEPRRGSSHCGARTLFVLFLFSVAGLIALVSSYFLAEQPIERMIDKRMQRGTEVTGSVTPSGTPSTPEPAATPPLELAPNLKPGEGFWAPNSAAGREDWCENQQDGSLKSSDSRWSPRAHARDSKPSLRLYPRGWSSLVLAKSGLGGGGAGLAVPTGLARSTHFRDLLGSGKPMCPATLLEISRSSFPPFIVGHRQDGVDQPGASALPGLPNAS